MNSRADLPFLQSLRFSFVCYKARPLIVVEYARYGDLLGYLRKSRRVHDDYYSDPSVKPCSELTSRNLLKFAWEISDGMDYLSIKKVVCLCFWNCDPVVFRAHSNMKFFHLCWKYMRLRKLLIMNSRQILVKFATFDPAEQFESALLFTGLILISSRLTILFVYLSQDNPSWPCCTECLGWRGRSL